MSFLFKKPHKSIPEFTGLQIQTSVNVLPIPIIYGCPRVPANLIYTNDFKATKVKQSKGGKGLLGGGKGDTGQYKYNATIILALGEGPMDNVVMMFQDQSVHAFIGDSMGLAGGHHGQAPWPFMVSTHPSDALGYTNTCNVAGPNLLLDSSATVPQFNFIPYGLYAGSSPLNPYVSTLPNIDNDLAYQDADPALCIYDLLTNPTYGVGFPASLIDASLFSGSDGLDPSLGDNTVQSYLQAVGMAFSVALNSSETVSSIFDRWCKLLGLAPVWNGTALKFVPYWDRFANANPGYGDDNPQGIPKRYFKPYVTPLFNLDDSDFIQGDANSDPVNVERIDIADVYNTVRLDYRNRGLLWNNDVIEAKDENTAQLFGVRIDSMGGADAFTEPHYAAVSAQIQLQRNISVRNKYTFRLSWEYAFLDCMDILTITDVTLGLNKQTVRVFSIEEDDIGILTLICEEFNIGAATATLYEKQESTSVIVTTNEPPDPVNPPMIFEPTAQMLAAYSQTQAMVVMAISGGVGGVSDPNWGGCNIYISTDNVTYALLGQLTGASRQGLLTATLAAYGGSNPDNTNTLQVTLAESDGELQSTSAAGAAAGQTMCAIVDTNGNLEFLSYTTATLVSGHTYNLTGLYRAWFGTDACAHGIGSKFCRVDSLLFEAVLPAAYVGVVLYLKFQSFNIFFDQSSMEALSDCVAYTYTPNGAGLAINNAVLNGLLLGQAEDWGGIINPVNDSLDLNWGGGFGACVPIIATVDLGGILP